MPVPADLNEAYETVTSYLTERGISYCRVGRHFSCLAGTRSDIDLIIPPHELHTVLYDFPDFCARRNLPIVNHIPHAQGFRFDLGWVRSDGSLALLPLDFCSDLTSAWRLFMYASELFETQVDSTD